MIELLLAFTFWPWVLALAFIFICGVSAYSEVTVIGVAGLIIFSAVAWLVYSSGPFQWVIDKPSSALFLGIIYCGVGGLWSLFKWRNWMVSDTIQDLLKSAKLDFDNDGEGEFIDSRKFPRSAKVSENKPRIVNWISLWPFSAFLYVFDDLLLKLFNRIYDLFSGAYVRITKRYLPQ